MSTILNIASLVGRLYRITSLVGRLTRNTSLVGRLSRNASLVDRLPQQFPGRFVSHHFPWLWIDLQCSCNAPRLEDVSHHVTGGERRLLGCTVRLKRLRRPHLNAQSALSLSIIKKNNSNAIFVRKLRMCIISIFQPNPIPSVFKYSLLPQDQDKGNVK